jgi:HAD superfamily hydrolase (TIGR01450 family)
MIATPEPRGTQRRWYSAYVFDLDGTVYLGDQLLPTVAESIQRLHARGVPVRYLSNNPTRDVGEYLDKLSRLGVPVQPGEVVNTLVSTTTWLRANRPDAVVFPIGEAPLIRALAEAGVETSDDPARIDIVLASYDRTFEYRKLQIAFDALWFHRRAVLMSTNPDRYCPFPGGRGQPDAASIVAAIEACTEVTCERTFGKPSGLMAEIVLSTVAAEPSEAVMVGDRLATDIAMGIAAGMDTALVLTGDSRREDVAGLPVAMRPTYVLDHLADLLPAD